MLLVETRSQIMLHKHYFHVLCLRKRDGYKLKHKMFPFNIREKKIL